MIIARFNLLRGRPRDTHEQVFILATPDYNVQRRRYAQGGGRAGGGEDN